MDILSKSVEGFRLKLLARVLCSIESVSTMLILSISFQLIYNPLFHTDSERAYLRERQTYVRHTEIYEYDVMTSDNVGVNTHLIYFPSVFAPKCFEV